MEQRRSRKEGVFECVKPGNEAKKRSKKGKKNQRGGGE